MQIWDILPNNNDAQSTTKYGFLLRPDTQIVALRAHCTHTALKAPPLATPLEADQEVKWQILTGLGMAPYPHNSIILHLYHGL